MFLLTTIGCLINTALYEERRALLTDDDGDGVSDLDGDCDDADPSALPGAAELCDGVDNDCDGTADEEAEDATWFADADRDGYGGGEAVQTCDPASGMTASGGDCDDTDAQIFPGSAERCNAVDDDCDDEVDEEGEVETLDWYLDADGDGYGGGDAIASCAQPEGAVARAGDCDDGNAAVSPSVAETCNGVDDDCNGAADDAEAVTWYLDRDGDRYGDDATTYLVCSPPPGYTAAAGDCDDLDPATHPGAEETCEDGLDADCDTLDAPCGIPAGEAGVDDASAIFAGATDETYAARSLAAGDLDGDGDDELLVARPGYDDFRGEVRVVPGGSDLWLGEFELDDVGTTLSSRTASAAFGSSLSSGHDLDGDGLDDVLVGATNARAAWIFTDAGGADLTTSDAWIALEGDRDGAFGIHAALVGDVDADGFGDWIVGDYLYGDTGAAWLYYGDGTGGTIGVDDDRAVLLEGEEADDRAGFRVAALGDVDGDGRGDFLVGGYTSDGGSSRSYLYFGTSTRLADGSLADADASIAGASGDWTFASVATAGDLNGDGHQDFALGAPQAGDYAGAVYVIVGRTAFPTSASVGDLADVTLTGAQAGIEVGMSVGGPGDLDGDGYGDLVANTSNMNASPAWAYLLAGGATMSATYTTDDARTAIAGASSSDQGDGMAGPGDFNGDGALDLALGAVSSSGNARAAWMMYGAYP